MTYFQSQTTNFVKSFSGRGVLQNLSQGEASYKTFHRKRVQKNLHRDRGFEKPLTGRGLLKNPSQGERFWRTFTGRRVLKIPSQGEGCWKTPHRERGFEKPLIGKTVLKHPSQGEGFWKTHHRERVFEQPLTGRGVWKIFTGRWVFKNLPQGEGFWKTLTGREVLKCNIHTYKLSNHLSSLSMRFKTPSLWRVFTELTQNPSPCDGVWIFVRFRCMYVCTFQTPLPYTHAQKPMRKP